MPNKKEYYPRANARKRMHRRPPTESMGDFEAIEYGKDKPKISEIEEALAGAKRSTEGIWRLAALMDNLAAYEFPRYTYYGRTSGMREFLARSPILTGKYKTLMRYKQLGERIRKAAGIEPIPYSDATPCYNLLWAFSPTLPDDIDEFDDQPVGAYHALRKVFMSLRGMNFKQMDKALKEDYDGGSTKPS